MNYWSYFLGLFFSLIHYDIFTIFLGSIHLRDEWIVSYGWMNWMLDD